MQAAPPHDPGEMQPTQAEAIKRKARAFVRTRNSRANGDLAAAVDVASPTQITE
jgi:hypothetical protein